MTHLPDFDLWTSGDNRVVSLPPSPDDVLVITTLGGRRVMIHPIFEYDHVIKIAQAFARRVRCKHPVTIKVLSLSLGEAQRMGLAPEDLLKDQTPEDRAAMRRFVVTTCLEVVRDCDDAAVRADAMRLAQELGVME